MKKIVLFVFTFIYSTISFATNQKEVKERLSFIDRELKKINQRISEGQNPSLFKKYITNFEKERDELKTKLLATTKKKNFKSKRRQKKIKKGYHFSLAGTPKERKENINRQLKEQRQKLLHLINTGVSGKSLLQTQYNINFLELEREKNNEKNLNKTKFSYKGHFQLRTESWTNTKGTQGTNQSDQTAFRLRTEFFFKPNDKLSFHLAPQAAKKFGAAGTSGTTTNPPINFYEANIVYKFHKNLNLEIGRQALAYGDHLIIGSLPWANNARSFDAVKFNYKHSLGWLDLVHSKISDNDSLTTSQDDSDLYILYSSLSFNNLFKSVDLYAIFYDDQTVENPEVNTFGLRLKGAYKHFFYGLEAGKQSGEGLGDDADQYDLEAGLKLSRYSLSAHYGVAGADYRQLFPTAHKFLGFADVLGRRNIKFIATHFKAGLTSWLKMRLDYHIFKRNDTSKSAHQLLGDAWGDTGTSDDIGSEIDLVFDFITSDKIKFQLGAALFTPGEYMQDQSSSDEDENTQFVYGQINASF